MTRRAYDPELEPLLPLLPTVSDLSSLAAIQEARAGRFAAIPVPPDRGDVAKEDRRVPGPAGAPDVAVRIYRPRAAGRGAGAARLRVRDPRRRLRDGLDRDDGP